jgi:hypothetical protein
MKKKAKTKTKPKAPEATRLQDEQFKILKESVVRDIVGGLMARGCDTQPPHA